MDDRAPLHSLPLRADWEQALIRARWPGGAPYEYRQGTQEYAKQYAGLLAEALTGERAAEVGPVLPGASEIQWACVYCRSNGPADNESHAVVLTRTHWSWACPATATVYDDTPPIQYDDRGRVRLNGAQGGDGYVQRVARHANMHRLYPDQVPEWTGQFGGSR